MSERGCSCRLGPVIELPPGVRAPSRYQQYWIRYALAAAAAGYAAIFLYRCVFRALEKMSAHAL